MILPLLARLDHLLVWLVHALLARADLWLAILAGMAVLRILRSWPRLYALCTLPATLTHELLHAGVGWLLMAQPHSLSLWPSAQGKSWRLGEVRFRHLRFYNALPVALAPILICPPLMWLVYQRHIDPQVHTAWLAAQAALLCYLAIAAPPSRQDWRVGLGQGWPLLALVVAAGLLFYEVHR